MSRIMSTHTNLGRDFTFAQPFMSAMPKFHNVPPSRYLSRFGVTSLRRQRHDGDVILCRDVTETRRLARPSRRMTLCLSYLEASRRGYAACPNRWRLTTGWSPRIVTDSCICCVHPTNIRRITRLIHHTGSKTATRRLLLDIGRLLEHVGLTFFQWRRCGWIWSCQFVY